MTPCGLTWEFEAMAKLIVMPASTYRAQLFTSPCGGSQFKIAGTLDGYLDLAMPDSGGTWQISLNEARLLIQAMMAGILDVETSCLYEDDALLAPVGQPPPPSPLPVA